MTRPPLTRRLTCTCICTEVSKRTRNVISYKGLILQSFIHIESKSKSQPESKTLEKTSSQLKISHMLIESHTDSGSCSTKKGPEPAVLFPDEAAIWLSKLN